MNCHHVCLKHENVLAEIHDRRVNFFSHEKDGSGSIGKREELLRADAKKNFLSFSCSKIFTSPRKPKTENESGQNRNLKTVGKLENCGRA